MVPSPRNIAPSESRTACARSPRDDSHSATGGPLTPVDVASTPVVNPIGTRIHVCLPGTRSASRRTTSPKPITARPTATCKTGFGSARSTNSPTTVPGAAATRIGATSFHATVGRRRSANSTSTFKSSPSPVPTTIAPTAGSTANSTGVRISEKPIPPVA